jgi:hypothetical protein
MADFVVYKRGGREPEKSVDRGAMLERVDVFLKGKAKAWLRQKDQPKFYRPPGLAARKVRRLTASAPEGQAVLVKREDDDEVLVIQKLAARAPVTNLGCHPQIEAAHQMLWSKFGEEHLRSAGRFYCRFIAGTNIVSRHGYVSPHWKGAAEDIFGEGSMNNMAGLEQIAKFLVRAHTDGKLQLYTVIYGDKRWRAGEGWGPYGGVYHTHVHYDALGGGPCSP